MTMNVLELPSMCCGRASKVLRIAARTSAPQQPNAVGTGPGAEVAAGSRRVITAIRMRHPVVGKPDQPARISVNVFCAVH
jgi:hypothetical protein